MRRRKLPDRVEVFYLTVVVLCLLGILVVCWSA